MTRDAIEALRYFSECSEMDVSDTISRLRDQRKLSSTVRALNGLLSDPAYSAAAYLLCGEWVSNIEGNGPSA